MTAVYLASRFSRIQELRAEAEKWRNAEIEVTSSWLEEDGESSSAIERHLTAEEIASVAMRDLNDIYRADFLIHYTEPERTPTRGGRHFETGYAYAHLIPVIIVGSRENPFYYIPDIKVVPSTEDAICYVHWLNRAVLSLGGETKRQT